LENFGGLENGPSRKGLYDFHFESAEDLRKIWAAGTINLKSGLLRLSQWTKDFKYLAHKQTHVSLWIRLVELPQEYWRERTLKEIASAVGTLIDIDGPTRNRTFGHYARILVDINLSKRAYDEILVEREGFAFKVEVQYERRQLFCHHCYSIGHNVSTCRWLHPQPPKDKTDRRKQIIVAEAAPLKPSRQQNDGGASTSANGSTWTWVPAPITSTVTTSQKVLVTFSPATLASPSMAIPASILSPAITSSSHMGPVDTFTSVVATSQMMVPVPKTSLSSTSFSFPLHNVFDNISSEKFPEATPVIEFISPVAHDDVHSERVERSHPTSQEEVMILMVYDVTVTLSDDVEHNHSTPRELMESPKGSHEHVPYSSIVEHDDVHEVSVESIHVQTDNLVEHVDVHYVPQRSPMDACFIDKSLVTHEVVKKPIEGTEEVAQAYANNTLTQNQDVHVAVEIQQQEVHPNKNIQHGLDLWARVRQYDERSAAEDFTPVLRRKKKKKLKLQQVVGKQPTKTRARGDHCTNTQ